MAQGSAKLAKKGKKASAAPAARAKKSVKPAVVAKKGRRFVAPKQSSSAVSAATSQLHREQLQVSKGIQKKNEALVSAKAVAAGVSFSLLTDIQEKGQKQLKQQLKYRDKQQQPRNAKVTQRLQQQLQKLKSKK